MKGFSFPNISIPSSIQLPSISTSGLGVDPSSIKSAIESSIPDLSNITGNINLENEASSIIQESVSEGIELPPELGSLIK